MLTRTTNKQSEVSLVILDDLVPTDHLLRKIDKVLDFNFVYPLVEHLYSNTGRPSIDPVVLIKYAFLNHLYGFNSMRRTFEEAKVNLAFRWFLGYGIQEKLPHFSDFSKTYTTKFSKEIEVKDKTGNVIGTTTLFQEIFNHILEIAIRKRYVDVAHIYMDSTNIKANANKKKTIKVTVMEESKKIQNELDQEIDQYCEKHGLKKPKPLKLKEKTISKSTVDEDCGVFNKGDHEVKMAYLSQTVCDQKGFILEAKVFPANLHDSTTFYEPFRNVLAKFEGIRSIGLDAGYKTPGVCREILKHGITPLLPYTRPKGKKYNEDNPVQFGKKNFTYDKKANVFYCPNHETLTQRSVDRKNGYIVYKTSVQQCKECPYKHKCLSKSVKTKEVRKHIWQDNLDQVELIRKSEFHAKYYPCRAQTIERDFADGKEKHGLRFTRLNGIKKVQDEVLLIFSMMNLKKIAKWACA